MQAIGRQPQRAPDGAPVHYERHRPEQTTLYCLVQQHAASFIAHTEASTGAELPRFIKDDFDAFLDRGILARGFLRLRCGECGHDKLLAFSCQAPRLLPLMRRAAHVADRGAPRRPRHTACAGAAVGAVAADPAAPAAGRTARADGEEARTLRPLQAAAITYRIAFGPRAWQKVLTLRGAMPREDRARQPLCADIDSAVSAIREIAATPLARRRA